MPLAQTPPPAGDDAFLRQVWPGYFSADAEDSAPLPAVDVALAPFLRSIVPGPPARGWVNRRPDLRTHFQMLEPEFGGAPRLAHLAACTIVCLRRNPADPSALALFRRILNEYGPEIAAAMNSRWLTSVCDTVVDTADSDMERAAAMIGSTFMAALKLAETELRMYRAPRSWPPKARLRRGGEIYDGVLTVNTINSGDVRNIFLRLETGLRIRADVMPFVAQLITRAIEGQTTLNRIVSLAGGGKLPLAPEEKLAALRKAMEGL